MVRVRVLPVAAVRPEKRYVQQWTTRQAAARRGSGTSSSGSSGSGTSSSGSSGKWQLIVGQSVRANSTLLGYTWETHNGSAPPVGNVNGNVGTFDPMNVSVGTELVLSLTQTQNGSQILSSGSEVMTKQTFTYGTFEFTSRVDNVLSGSDSSGFLYASNSLPKSIWSK